MRPHPHRDTLLGFLSTQHETSEPERALPVDPQRQQDPAVLILVDAAADLPRGVAADPALRVLPLALRLRGRKLRASEAARRSARQRFDASTLRQARLEWPDAGELAWRLHPNLALNGDVLIVLGNALGDAGVALHRMLAERDAEIRELRASRGLPEALQTVRIDTGGAFAVPALHASALLRAKARGADADALVRLAQGLAASTRHWLLPRAPRQFAATLSGIDDPRLRAWTEACTRAPWWSGYPLLEGDADGLRCASRARGWDRALGKACDAVGQALRPGAQLLLSVDGSVAEFVALPAVAALRARAQSLGVRMQATHLSVASRIRAGAGTASLALLDQPA